MAELDQLYGWKEIADFLGTSERTARRWESERALPVRRMSGGGRDLVSASRAEINHWRANGGCADPEDPSATQPGVRPSHEPNAASVITGAVDRPPARIRRRWFVTAGLAVALAVPAI
jgi:predicted DNA-binding transcriptional regulator AlpA